MSQPPNEYQNPDYINANMAGKLKSVEDADFMQQLKALWGYLSDRPAGADVALVVFALAYFLWPLDVLPDPIYIDDVAVVAMAVAALGERLRKYL